MTRIVASCGLDCAACPAFIAAKTNDDELREKTAAQWSKEFGFPCKPQDVNCHGCHAADGVQVGYCRQCGIRACAYGKGYRTCAECGQMDSCKTLGDFIAKIPGARENLMSLRT